MKTFRRLDHTVHILRVGSSFVLSNRALLTTALVGFVLAAPIIAADGSEELAPEPSYETIVGTYNQFRSDFEVIRGDVDSELSDQGIDPDVSDERRNAYKSARDARIFLESTLVTLQSTLDEAAQNAPPVPDLPESFELLGQEDGTEAADGPTTQSSASAQWEVPTQPLMVLAASTIAAAGLFFWLAGSSGTLGGAAGAGTAAAEAANRKFLPYASPLFTRFEKDTVLDHPKREGIYGMIVMKPGVTLQDLCEGTGLSRTAVSHHLRLMEQQHLVVSKRVGRSRHFFENGGRYGRDQKDAYAVLHNDRSKEVHGFIETNPGAIQKDLCEALGIQASVVHWHVKRLLEANLIEAIRQGRTVSYFPNQSIRGLAA